MQIKMSGNVAESPVAVPAAEPRRALLVYKGEFDSMDGPVEITEEHIEKLCSNHNQRLASLESPSMKDYPPIQLDHSTSAKDTVGRLVGPVEVGEFEGRPALYGHVQILGAENQEKIADGRWTHLSIGADLQEGVIQELTITPFPAAKSASLLKSKKRLAEDTEKLGPLRIEIEHDDDDDDLEQLSSASIERYGDFKLEIKEKDGKHFVFVNGSKMDGFFHSAEEALSKAKKKIDILFDSKSRRISQLARKNERTFSYNGHRILTYIEDGAEVAQILTMPNKPVFDQETDRKGEALEQAKEYIDAKGELTNRDAKSSKLARDMKIGTMSYNGHKFTIYQDGDGKYYAYCHTILGNPRIVDDALSATECAKQAKSYLDKSGAQMSKMSRLASKEVKKVNYKGKDLAIYQNDDGSFVAKHKFMGSTVEITGDKASIESAEKSARRWVDSNIDKKGKWDDLSDAREKGAKMSKMAGFDQGITITESREKYKGHTFEVIKKVQKSGTGKPQVMGYQCEIEGEGVSTSWMATKDRAVAAIKKMIDANEAEEKLSQKGAKMSRLAREKVREDRHALIKYIIYKNDDGSFSAEVPFINGGENAVKKASSVEEAGDKAAQFIDKYQKGAKMSKKLKDKEAELENCDLAEDEDEDTKKLAKCEDDEDEDTKHLSEDEDKEKEELEDDEDKDKVKMGKDDDDDEKHLSEDDEEESEEEDKKDTKMSSSHGKAKLSAFKKKADHIRLALTTASLKTKFNRLRSQAKISPAELKKVDFVKLAKQSEDVREIIIKSYEEREPVIIPGLYGTLKALSAADIARQVKLQKLEDETRANFSSVPKKARLAEDLPEGLPVNKKANMKEVDDVEMADDDEGIWKEMVKAIKAGDDETGKAIFKKMKKLGLEDTSAMDEKHLAALMADIADLETEFESVVRLGSKTK